MQSLSFFPEWVRVTHVLNILFISLMIRSGIQILASFPRLFLRDDTRPGTEWLTLTRTTVPLEDPDIFYRRQMAASQQPRIHTAHDENLDVTPWIALPGHKNLGLGRHWHFIVATLWMINGIVFIIWVFSSGYWQYLIPRHWSIVPTTLDDIWTYLTFHLPDELPGEPFNGVQKLSYFAVIFILAPLQIATAAAMSPSVSGRLPWYPRIFGGHQKARSLHFLGMILFILFTMVHTLMVILHGIVDELGLIIWGQPERPIWTIVIAGTALALIILINWLGSALSLRYPRATQRILGLPMKHLIGLSLGWERSRQHYPQSAISRYFWANGHPPVDTGYQNLVKNQFRDWRLEITGLVEHPLCLSLDDLRAMPSKTQITEHVCIQGWTGIGSWTGVSMLDIMEQCRPSEKARYVVFRAMDNKGETDRFTGKAATFFYGTLNMRNARDPQTILAYEYNGEALTIPHGAPLRLRVETQLGFKMVKWLSSIEFVEQFRDIGEGQGGWREDHEYYDPEAGI